MSTDTGAAAAEKTIVSVAHGNLGFARHVVAVGHYANDLMSSAEAYLDECLQGAMRQQYQLGIYPGLSETAAIFLNPEERARPAGAIVVGLGSLGQLTTTGLTKAFAHAVLCYAFSPGSAVSAARDAGARRSVSTLLLGTGRGLLTVEESMLAMLRGVLRANLALRKGDNATRTITTLEFVEVWEDLAIQAARALEQSARDSELAAAFDCGDARIREARGRQVRVAFNDTPGWWQRLQIHGHGSGALEFTTLTDRARTEVTLLPTQRLLVDQFVNTAVANTGRDDNVGRVLFELLMPNALKEQLDTRRQHMVLLLNDAAARYPWELLDDRSGDGDRPLAADIGIIRQLETAAFRRGVQAAPRDRALLVGDPKSSMMPLESAQKEINVVQIALLEAGYEITRKVRCGALEIVEALFAREYRILHLCGHGLLDKQIASTGEVVSGMVIGDDFFLAARDVEQMRQVPEVVFINCCYLGRVSGPPVAEWPYHELAANLGAQFIRMGVRAVVAAGWAVDDDAGKTFAATFYQRLLAGAPFGQAVLAARRRTYEAHPGVNTWGAYQCYGDPGYTVRPAGETRSDEGPAVDFRAPGEAVAALENLVQGALTASAASVTRMREQVAAVAGAIPPAWMARARIRAALARAYDELELFAEAIEHYETLLQSVDADFPISALERLADCRGAWAMELWRASRASADGGRTRSDLGPQLASIDTAIALVERLRTIADTPERQMLLGAAFRRRACLSQGNERREAIEQMRRAFRDAFSRGRASRGATDPGAIVQWTAAELAIAGQAPAAGDAPIDEWLDRLQHAESGTARRAGPGSDIFDLTIAAECALLRHVVRADLEAHAGEVVNRYAEVRFRTTSPREFRLALELLEFLIEMQRPETGDAGRSSLAAGLQAVHDPLSFWLMRPLRPAGRS